MFFIASLNIMYSFVKLEFILQSLIICRRLKIIKIIIATPFTSHE